MATFDDKERKSWSRFRRLKFDSHTAGRKWQSAERASLNHAKRFIVKRWKNIDEVRHLVVFWVLAVSVLILSSGVQFLWDQQSYRAVASAPGGSYIEAIRGELDSLNPLYAGSSASESVSELMFSRLLNYDKSGNLGYDLAKSTNVSKDRLTYRVVIRDDAIWHDGEKLLADDVLFTVKLLQDEEAQTKIRGWDSVEVTVIDDQTIDFKLESPFTFFREALTFPIVPKHLLENVPANELREAEFSKKPIGSGPFKFVSSQSGLTAGSKVVHLDANSDYYAGPPLLSKFQLSVASSDEAMRKILVMNEANEIANVSYGGTLQKLSSQYKVQSRPIQAGVYAFMNSNSSVLRDKSVRQALQMSINTEEIRERILGVQKLDLPYTSLRLQSAKGIPEAPMVDLEKAARLLDAAGWRMKDGVRVKDGQELRLTIVTTKNAAYERALEVIIGQLREVGVLVNERIIDAADPAQRFEQSVIQPRDYDILIYQLTMPDADMYQYWHSSGTLNLANYRSPTADVILQSIRTTPSTDLLPAKYVAFAKKWLDDAPAVGLYQVASYDIVANRVAGQSDAVLITPTQRYASVNRWTVRERSVYKTP